ncbi:hypothetical protein DITRI_Ditri03aG0031200 [Diplodiscus trichospermus]
MALLARNDPFFRQLHSLLNDQRRPFQFIGKLDSLENYNVGGGGFKSNKPAVGLNLTLKCCFEDCRRTWDQKARAFAPQLAGDLEIIRHYNEPQKMAKLAVDTYGACRRGNRLDFLDKSLPGKIAVAVDVDEVLGNLVSALIRFIGDRYSMNHSVSEYHVYEFFKIWNCSRDEADIRVHEFFKTQYFKKGIHPIPGAQRALHKLSRFCNLSVATLLGSKILIDDNPRFAVECAQVGIRVLLFDYENSYPWCKTESINQHPLVTKVHNWEEVVRQIDSWILSSTIL